MRTFVSYALATVPELLEQDPCPMCQRQWGRTWCASCRALADRMLAQLRAHLETP